MVISSPPVRLFLGCLALLAAAAACAAPPSRFRIAVLKSQDAAPYRETLEGYQLIFSRQMVPVDWTVFELNGDPARAERTALEIGAGRSYDLVFSLGALATEKAAAGIRNIPLVAGMILRGDLLEDAPHATGVILGFPVDTHFDWMKRIVPGLSSVGILYNPLENGELVPQVAAAARRRGLRLEAVKVEHPRDIPAALERLSGRAEAIWGIPDAMVLNGQTARQILLFCFRNRIPFIGVSSSWTKAGALYSLDRDYGDMGEQCAQASLRILHGTPPSSIPVATPRRALYSLNLRTAEYLQLRFPDSLIRGAVEVFEADADD